jgi:hypothetical protein
MKAFSITFLAILLSLLAHGQHMKRLKEFSVECRGWKTLPFAGEKADIKDLDPVEIDGIKVQLRRHDLSEEVIVYHKNCNGYNNKQVIQDKVYGHGASVVREFFTYELDGHIFAYRFAAFSVMVKNRRLTQRTGAAAVFCYGDSAGDGIFEPYPESKLHAFLPDWVKAPQQDR